MNCSILMMIVSDAVQRCDDDDSWVCMYVHIVQYIYTSISINQKKKRKEKMYINRRKEKN